MSAVVEHISPSDLAKEFKSKLYRGQAPPTTVDDMYNKIALLTIEIDKLQVPITIRATPGEHEQDVHLVERRKEGVRHLEAQQEMLEKLLGVDQGTKESDSGNDNDNDFPLEFQRPIDDGDNEGTKEPDMDDSDDSDDSDNSDNEGTKEPDMDDSKLKKIVTMKKNKYQSASTLKSHREQFDTNDLDKIIDNFQTYDLNGDGRLSVGEFKQLTGSHQEQFDTDDLDKIIDNFQTYDLNEDGRISVGEFKQLTGLSINDIQELIQPNDLNKDGTISVEEYVKWCIDTNAVATWEANKEGKTAESTVGEDTSGKDDIDIDMAEKHIQYLKDVLKQARADFESEERSYMEAEDIATQAVERELLENEHKSSGIQSLQETKEDDTKSTPLASSTSLPSTPLASLSSPPSTTGSSDGYLSAEGTPQQREPRDNSEYPNSPTETADTTTGETKTTDTLEQNSFKFRASQINDLYSTQKKKKEELRKLALKFLRTKYGRTRSQIVNFKDLVEFARNKNTIVDYTIFWTTHNGPDIFYLRVGKSISSTGYMKIGKLSNPTAKRAKRAKRAKTPAKTPVKNTAKRGRSTPKTSDKKKTKTKRQKINQTEKIDRYRSFGKYQSPAASVSCVQRNLQSNIELRF